MAYPVVCVEITVRKIFELRNGWKTIEGWIVVHIYGAGKNHIVSIRSQRVCSLVWHYGRSVHNIRIERLWCNVTRGFGVKWKDFFQGLEMYDNLDVNLDAHIWLLHFLFLQRINQDAAQWAEAWNHHPITIRGDHPRTPRDLFFFGMLQHGTHGINFLQPSEESEDIGDLQEYGIDWEAFDEDDIRNHHHQANSVEEDVDNPFVVGPLHLSDVQVPEADCPLTDMQVLELKQALEGLPHYFSTSMYDLRLLWVDALQICHDLLQVA